MIKYISPLSFMPCTDGFDELFKKKMIRDNVYDENTMGVMFIEGRKCYGYYTNLMLSRFKRKTKGPVFISDSGIEVYRKSERSFKMVFPSGNVKWFNNRGQLHRTRGPAVISTCGDKAYYQNGELYRANGPAIVKADNLLKQLGIDGIYNETTNQEETKPKQNIKFMKNRNEKTKDAISHILSNGNTLIVEFTKKNGEKREMECTTNVERIPTDMLPKNGNAADSIEGDYMRVYDVNAEGWRSFRFESVSEYTCKKVTK